MAERRGGSAGTPIGKWAALEPPAAPAGLQFGFAGSWAPLARGRLCPLGPRRLPGGAPRACCAGATMMQRPR
eukprot:12779680-Alexandrium_andersonii.AAC.1